MSRLPQMFRRKSDGRYAVKLKTEGRRRTFYLGSDRASATELYRRIIAEWLSSPSTLGHTRPRRRSSKALTVAEVANAYLDYAQQKYVDEDGNPKTEIGLIRNALLILGRVYGSLPARDFDQSCLEALRGEMIRHGGKKKPWSRRTINDHVGRLKRMFRWAALRKLIPSSVCMDLATVEGLRSGETEAPDGQGVAPVKPAHIEALKPHLSSRVWAMIQVQLFSGARPGEICKLRGADIDMSGSEWLFKPARHKTQRHGHQRVIVLGPRAQDALRPFLSGDPDKFLFSPKEAVAELNAKKHAARRTPLSCGNRPGSNRNPDPAHEPGEVYTVHAYRRAIHRACDRAGIARWSPHQLRHLAADRAARVDGPEGARCLLGHRSVSVTATYMSRDEERAREIARKIG